MQATLNIGTTPALKPDSPTERIEGEFNYSFNITIGKYAFRGFTFRGTRAGLDLKIGEIKKMLPISESDLRVIVGEGA